MAWTDVKQMFVVVFGMSAAVVILLVGIFQHATFAQALHLAGATGRLQAIDFKFDLRETYTFWSGMIGGLFLMLSYFGCDQSQVQRYLTAKSIDEARQSLMMSAFVKIPLQLLILDDRRPGLRVLSVPGAADAVQPRVRRAGGGEPAGAGVRRAAEGIRRRDRHARSGGRARRIATAFLASDARVQDIRAQAAGVVKQATGDERYNDVNYVFPTFITTQMPIGLVGLMIAAIFAAAMSASGGELNALATATVIDFYRRHFVKDATDAHYLRVSEGRDDRVGARLRAWWRCTRRIRGR